MLAQLLAARMGITHGMTGCPVSLAHSMRNPHTEASTQATASKLRKNIAPMVSITMRTIQRVIQFKNSFKAMPFSVLPALRLAART